MIDLSKTFLLCFREKFLKLFMNNKYHVSMIKFKIRYVKIKIYDPLL